MKTFSPVWIEPLPVDVPRDLLDFIGEPRIIAELLYTRGIHTPQQAKAFLNPAHYTPASPFDLPDMEKASSRITDAIQRHEKIAVWGDFDVDGQTSTTLLYSVLRQLGADVIYHIPVRARESHGVNVEILAKLHAQGVQVVLTCDTGITAFEAAQYALENHFDLVITDHHTLPPQLPPAYAVVNPQRLPDHHPLRTLPGVGTAYEFSQAICHHGSAPEIARQNLDLVALGTVADVAHLTADARYQVQLGLQQLRSTQRLGLQALYENAEITPAQLTEEQIGFAIAPRLNAIGRLADANPIVDFFTTTDNTTAHLIAAQLEGLNARRKLLCDQVFQGALQQLEKNPSLLEDPCLVLSHPQWPAGVVGIVASRLVDLFQRPVILLTTPADKPAHGSARSVEGINITSAISANAHLLNRFGGHPMAAGLSLPAERIPEFRRAISRTVQNMVQENPPLLELKIDVFQPFDQLSLDFVAQLDRLAPFGAGNPSIVMATRNVIIKESSTIGKTQDHLQLLLADENDNTRRVIWWQGAGSPLPSGRFDLAYTARATNFRGQTSVSLEWVAAREIEESISITSACPLEIFDHRAELDPEKWLAEYQKQPGVLIYREGESTSAIAGVDRNTLSPSPTLLIWNVPPSSDELHHALKAVTPSRVILFGVPSGTDHINGFLSRLLGLVRYAIKHQDGWLTLSRLAAACGQRQATIQLGLSLLVARGIICHLRTDETGTQQVVAGGISVPADIARLEKDLTYILQETAAYRSFYLRADPQKLLPD